MGPLAHSAGGLYPGRVSSQSSQSSQGERHAQGLVDHFFRHEAGRLIASLVGRYGGQRIDAIEDAVQAALQRARGSWTVRGVPDNPSAWLSRVAHNQLIDQLR